MIKKQSPYYLFKKWLFDRKFNSKLDEDVEKIITPIVVLAMFGKCDNITIYLNNYFNTFTLMKLKPIEFYNEIKKLVINNNISYNDLSFFNLKKEKNEYSHIYKLYPYLKKYEIDILIDKIKSEKEDISFIELLENKKQKIKKNKNKGKK